MSPHLLELLHVRQPPPQNDPNVVRYGGVQRMNATGPITSQESYDVHTPYYSNGVFLMADARSTVHMELHSIC